MIRFIHNREIGVSPPNQKLVDKLNKKLERLKKIQEYNNKNSIHVVPCLKRARSANNLVVPQWT